MLFDVMIDVRKSTAFSLSRARLSLPVGVAASPSSSSMTGVEPPSSLAEDAAVSRIAESMSFWPKNDWLAPCTMLGMLMLATTTE